MSEKNITYNEANKLIPKNSYAEIVRKKDNPAFQSNSATSINHNIVPPTIQPSTSNIVYRHFNQNSSQQPGTSSKFTVFKSAAKRVRPSSPNPVMEEHNNIIRPSKLEGFKGGIFNKSNYQKNIGNNEVYNVDVEMIDSVVELITTSVISVLSSNNKFNLQQTEFINIVKDRLLKYFNSGLET